MDVTVLNSLNNKTFTIHSVNSRQVYSYRKKHVSEIYDQMPWFDNGGDNVVDSIILNYIRGLFSSI